MTTTRTAEQHEDWLNLTDPEPPWFAHPVLMEAFPQGLDPTPPELRVEQRRRWYGDEEHRAVRTATDRGDYLEWLLRDVLRWGDDYLTGDRLPSDMAQGVSYLDVTIVPTGIYQTTVTAPVGIDNSGDTILDDTTRPGDRPRVLVFVLPPGCDPVQRPPADRRDAWTATYVQRAAKACRYYGVPLALVTDGDYLTLVHAPISEPTGWGSWKASELAAEPVLFDSFRSMLGADRFTLVTEKDTPEALLAKSTRIQADITDTLGSQVRKATELLVNAISRANINDSGVPLKGVAPEQVYQAAVTVMMRIVFLLFAEENDLLPIDNDHYQQLYAVRALREDLEADRYEIPEAMEARSTAWHRLLSTFRAVHGGVKHDELSIVAYGGRLFDPDRFAFLEGRSIDSSWQNRSGAPIQVSDFDMLAILNALLILGSNGHGSREGRRLSYRNVGVEQIGHIYERLLDHGVRRADTVVLGLRGKAGEEPEIALPELEARREEGLDCLIAYLSDSQQGHRVGTPKQVRKWLAGQVDERLWTDLIQACQANEALARRIEPFAGLLRLDLRDRPLVFQDGAVYVTEVGSRRDSGTAYTTRELADEVAEHALAPMVYSPGPQDTPDTSLWRVRSSADILALKICDPTVGSGAILVAACRYLAGQLIKAWEAEGDQKVADLSTAADDPNRLGIIAEARRLVAEHCCYGVDRDPMAVEMAKLSMWLTTLARDRPFTFLDHAIKAGDSMLGIWDIDQLRYLHYNVIAGRSRDLPISGWSPGGDALIKVNNLIDSALSSRSKIGQINTKSPADIETKEQLYDNSEHNLELLGAIADVMAGAALITAGDRDSSSALTTALDSDLDVVGRLVGAIGTPSESVALEAAQSRARLRLDAGRPEGAPRRQPFHYPIEFPEVFVANSAGFDTMIGNPPFMGGRRISGAVGTDYRQHIINWFAEGQAGPADLVAYFFLAATKVARSFGYLATNTIAQGDTSEVALAQIVKAGWTIHRATSSISWPGDTSLEIAKVWMTKEKWVGDHTLNESSVTSIDEMLYPTSRSRWRKKVLRQNKNKSFQGSIVLGDGFIMSPEEANRLIENEPRNADILFPYLNGQDLNQSPTLSASRWVINFFDWPEKLACKYSDCWRIVDEKVKPERLQKDESKYPKMIQKWWCYWNERPNLYKAIKPLNRVIAIAITSKYRIPVFVSANQVYSHAVVVWSYDDEFHLGVLTSGFHNRWVIRYGSSLENRIRYTPTDVFETFPQPLFSSDVETAGKELDEYRTPLMVDLDLGLTKLYNRVHDPDDRDLEIVKLRDCHVTLDVAVRDAYGWDDLDLNHDFYHVRPIGTRFTFAPQVADEILVRLLELNQERYEAEVVAGLHGNRTRVSHSSLSSGQGDLLEGAE